MTDVIRPFQYRISQLGYRPLPGVHTGDMTGSGQLFKRHDSLLANPDPRRLDLRATLLNPFNEYRVKVYQQASRVSVYIIADLSASMSFTGSISKQKVLADFVLSAAYSTMQTGDRFHLLGCADVLDKQLSLLAEQGFGAMPEVSKKLAIAKLKGCADSLMQVRTYLPSKRSLVFLVSDFHFSNERVKELLRRLSGHAIVPVALWDEAEYKQLPEWGIWKVKDLETRSTRTLFLRPAYKQKILKAFQKRKRDLQLVFRSFAAEPVFIDGAYQAEQMSEYFYGRAI